MGKTKSRISRIKKMTINKQDKFGIIFTICLVGFIIVIIQMLSSTVPNSERIIIIVICGGVLSIAAFFSYRKKPSNHTFVLTNTSYMIFFIIGIVLGLLVRASIDAAYGIDYQKAEPTSIYYGISLIFGGYYGFYFFNAMSMVVSLIRIPFIRTRLRGDTRWIPSVEGVTFGFAVMTFYELFSKGIPKLWFIFSSCSFQAIPLMHQVLGSFLF